VLSTNYTFNKGTVPIDSRWIWTIITSMGFVWKIPSISARGVQNFKYIYCNTVTDAKNQGVMKIFNFPRIYICAKYARESRKDREQIAFYSQNLTCVSLVRLRAKSDFIGSFLHESSSD
jgi:hypothetical protein